MKNFPYHLLILLSDQKIHSGEEIGLALGISRSAVWKQLRKIHNAGFNVSPLPGRGYLLDETVDLLDEAYIVRELEEKYALPCTVMTEIDSTNSYLLRALQVGSLPSGLSVVAEAQTAGRGRRGRQWVSPFAKNLYFSVNWNFQSGMSCIEGLSLVVGISIAEALREIGLQDVSVKWPNDIVVANKKLAGILLEVMGDPTGLCHVVIGVGLNVYMRAGQISGIDQEWTALQQLLDLKIKRSEMFVRLMHHLVNNLKKFERDGFAAFISAWDSYDAYRGQEVCILLGDRVVIGVASGVSNTGELLVSNDAGIQSFSSGEVSLRKRW